MINIGIDNGNYNTKSSDGFLYPSGFIASSQPPVGEADYLRSVDTFYALGA
jgi:plasmid segregation protein ParM